MYRAGPKLGTVAAAFVAGHELSEFGVPLTMKNADDKAAEGAFAVAFGMILRCSDGGVLRGRLWAGMREALTVTQFLVALRGGMLVIASIRRFQPHACFSAHPCLPFPCFWSLRLIFSRLGRFGGVPAALRAGFGCALGGPGALPR